MDAQPKIPPSGSNQAERFVKYVIEKMAQDKGFTARLKRADNPATEFYSWELLAAFNIDLEKSWQRLPYCTIVAALSRAKLKQDGRLSLGQALAACYPQGNQAEPATARLRRLLACSSGEELCAILRPLLALMHSREVIPNYARLLNQIVRYHGDSRQCVRAEWAKGFFSCQAETKDQGEIP